MTPLPLELERILRPYQVQPARQLFRALTHGEAEWGYPGAVDLSDVGIGKTYQDLAAMLAMGRKVGILCPPAGKMGWEAAFAVFGATPAFLESYEAMRSGFRPNIARRTQSGFVWKEANLGLICDEAHACRNDGSLTTFCIEGIFSQKVPTIAASATLAISPAELYIAGRITGLHDGTNEGWLEFLADNGCTWSDEANRWTFKDLDEVTLWNPYGSHLKNLHTTLIPERGCRVRVADCGHQEKTTINLLEIETPEAEAIREKWKDGQESMKNMKESNVPAEVIKDRLRLLQVRTLQACDMSMVPYIAERAMADLENDCSVVMFFSWTESRVAMARALNRWEGLHGQATPMQKKRWVADFQADKIHVLLNNVGSGGSSVSLHDLHGNRPRVSYIFPVRNPVHAGQAPGRISRTGGKTESVQWLPCIPRTLSAWTMKRTAEKLRQLAKLNNG
jgi:hypothetical protein